MSEMANFVYKKYMNKVSEMKEQFEQMKEMYAQPIGSIGDTTEPEQMEIDQPSTSKIIKEKKGKEPKEFVPSLIENEIEDVDTSKVDMQKKSAPIADDVEMEEAEDDE